MTGDAPDYGYSMPAIEPLPDCRLCGGTGMIQEHNPHCSDVRCGSGVGRTCIGLVKECPCVLRNMGDPHVNAILEASGHG